MGMSINGGQPGHHASSPAGPSSLPPTAPAFVPISAPSGPRAKDHRPWAERTAARAAEQAEAEAERERRAVREADHQEMLRHKEEKERKNQPLGGKEWAERAERLEARALERARLAQEAEQGTRSAEPTPDRDVEMRQDPSPLPSPARPSVSAPSPAVDEPVSRESAIHPSRRSYVQTPSRAIKAEDDAGSLTPSDLKPSATPVVHDRPTSVAGPTASSRRLSDAASFSAGPPSASSLPIKSEPPASNTRFTPISSLDRKPAVHLSSQSRERSPPSPPRPAARPTETAQEERERLQRERSEAYLAKLLRDAKEVDLYRHWGGQGKIQSDAAVRSLSLSFPDRLNFTEISS